VLYRGGPCPKLAVNLVPLGKRIVTLFSLRIGTLVKRHSDREAKYQRKPLSFETELNSRPKPIVLASSRVTACRTHSEHTGIATLSSGCSWPIARRISSTGGSMNSPQKRPLHSRRPSVWSAKASCSSGSQARIGQADRTPAAINSSSSFGPNSRRRRRTLDRHRARTHRRGRCARVGRQRQDIRQETGRGRPGPARAVKVVRTYGGPSKASSSLLLPVNSAVVHHQGFRKRATFSRDAVQTRATRDPQSDVSTSIANASRVKSSTQLLMIALSHGDQSVTGRDCI
jgi:hypothetical protein